MKIIKLLEIIANKNYIVYLENNNIFFGYINNDKLENDLSTFEIINIRTIYNFLVGNKKDLINLSNTKINNSLVSFFYNPKNRLYAFYEIKNNKYTNLDVNTISKLNCIFNNQDNKLYQDKNNINNKKIKIILKTSAGLITVYILSSLVLSYLPNMPQNQFSFKIDYTLDKIYKNANYIEKNTDYSFDELKEIIDSNSNLNDEEKNFLYNLKDEIDENIDYIDIKQVKNNLTELDINYNFKSQENIVFEKESTSSNIQGSYTFMGRERNRIDLYDNYFAEEANFSSANKATLIHELNHLISKRPLLLYDGTIGGNIKGDIIENTNIYNNVLAEMVNEMFAREYSTYCDNIEFSGYDELMPVMYALAEIIDEDTLRRYKFNSDDYYLNNYFKSLGIDDKYIYTLYKDLNLITSDVLEASEKEYICQEVYNIISHMYQKKYDDNMESDMVMLAYFYNTQYSNKGINALLEKELNIDNIIKIAPKGYFSKQYKQMHPDVEVYIYSEDKESVFNLSDKISYSNRIIYLKNK